MTKLFGVRTLSFMDKHNDDTPLSKSKMIPTVPTSRQDLLGITIPVMD